jgi:hypothetical protein
MLDRRGKKIRQKAEDLFGVKEEDFNLMFADKTV